VESKIRFLNDMLSRLKRRKNCGRGGIRAFSTEEVKGGRVSPRRAGFPTKGGSSRKVLKNWGMGNSRHQGFGRPIRISGRSKITQVEVIDTENGECKEDLLTCPEEAPEA